MPSSRRGRVTRQAAATRGSDRSQPSSLSEGNGNNSSSTEEDGGSVASDLSDLQGSQSPQSSSTRSVRSTNSSRSRSRALNPLRTNARGIPEPVLKEIVTDLENNGGLRFNLSTPLSLTSFCDARVEDGKESIYGVYGSRGRVQVENKIRSWGRLPTTQYQDILLFLGITPAELRSNFAQQFAEPAPPRSVSVPGSSPRASATKTRPSRTGTPLATPRATPQAAAREGPRSTPGSAATEDTPKYSNLRVARGGFGSYREPKAVLSSSDEEANSRPLRKNMSFQRADEIPIEPITVDPNNLEMTPFPFKVKKAYGLKGTDEGKKYDGFLITMTVDPHDALGIENIGLIQFPFEAVVHSDTEIDVSAPLLEFNERGGHDEFIRAKWENLPNKEGDALIDSMDNARKRFELKYGTLDRINKKIYRLVFPSGTKLSGKVLDCNTAAVRKNEKALTLGGYTIDEPISALNKKPAILEETISDDGKHTKTYLAVKCNVVPKLYWRVADIKSEGVLTGPSFIQKGQKGTDAAAALFDDSPFYMPHIARALPGIGRSNVDPPSTTSGDPMDSSPIAPNKTSSSRGDDPIASGVVPVNTVSVSVNTAVSSVGTASAAGATSLGVVPDNPTSGVVPDNSTLGVVPNNPTSGGARVVKGSSLKQAMMKVKEAAEEKGLEDLINEGWNDLKQGWKEMGVDDEDMVDAKESKKRERSCAEEVDTSNPIDQGELLAPFPLVPDPVAFVQENLSGVEMERIMAEPPDQRQNWLMCHLKEVLLMFSDKDKGTILAHPKEQRFEAMKRVYERLLAEHQAATGQVGSS